MKREQVQSLVRELRSPMPHGVAKKIKGLGGGRVHGNNAAFVGGGEPNQLFQIRIQGLSPDACLGFQGPGVCGKSPVMKKLEDGLQERRPLAVAFFHSESNAWCIAGAQWVFTGWVNDLHEFSAWLRSCPGGREGIWTGGSSGPSRRARWSGVPYKQRI